MSLSIRNSDLVLHFSDHQVDAILNKYTTYLEALYDETYSFHRDALRVAVGFLLSPRYASLEELAGENYDANPRIRDLYTSKRDYINAIPLARYKSCSLDLATGSGKSYLLFGIAQVMLSEQAVDKVLVLCPSLTIEEGLTQKFQDLNNRKDLVEILLAVNPNYLQPEIKNASETVLPNNVCIENIHATYQRTGSSIRDSFKAEGQRVLVLNDEAHHIFSGEVDSRDRKWLDFLRDPEYGFNYVVNVTGTPYYGPDKNQYFRDILYRFGLKDAVDRGIVKKVDYKKFDEYKDDKGYQQSWAIHKKNCEEYGEYILPISVVVCADIADAIIEWDNVVQFLVDKENITREDAEEKCIWVTSGLPSGKADRERIKKIISQGAEKIRLRNLDLLKRVDEPDSRVEWIVSVSMLTEGWDVKNVFQVVPHKQRAFNSKLLIAQVLGRGLRIPQALKMSVGADKIYLRVNNHEKWSPEIKQLYDEVLEVENRLSWGYDSRRSKYDFTLHNMTYEPVEITKETKKEKAHAPKTFGFGPQAKSQEYKAEFSYSTIGYVFEDKETYSIDVAATNLHSYLKEKSPAIAAKYSKKKLREDFQQELRQKGYEDSFLNKENYLKAQQAFGPMFREPGKEVPRVSDKADSLFEISLPDFPRQHFSEDMLKRIGYLVYSNTSADWYEDDEKQLFMTYTHLDEQRQEIIGRLEDKGADTVALAAKLTEIATLQRVLQDHLAEKADEDLKTSLNAVYVTYKPEIEFVKTLFLNIDCIDAFIKSPDQGFYSFPYSYKPETEAKTHVKYENFNPDFFLKIKGSSNIVVVETKKAGDDSNKNRAKYRDGISHFDLLNRKLEETNKPERYYFKFVSDEGSDIADFFKSIRNRTYKEWCSSLMNQLSGN